MDAPPRRYEIVTTAVEDMQRREAEAQRKEAEALLKEEADQRKADKSKRKWQKRKKRLNATEDRLLALLQTEGLRTDADARFYKELALKRADDRMTAGVPPRGYMAFRIFQDSLRDRLEAVERYLGFAVPYRSVYVGFGWQKRMAAAELEVVNRVERLETRRRAEAAAQAAKAGAPTFTHGGMTRVLRAPEEEASERELQAQLARMRLEQETLQKQAEETERARKAPEARFLEWQEADRRMAAEKAQMETERMRRMKEPPQKQAEEAERERKAAEATFLALQAAEERDTAERVRKAEQFLRSLAPPTATAAAAAAALPPAPTAAAAPLVITPSVLAYQPEFIQPPPQPPPLFSITRVSDVRQVAPFTVSYLFDVLGYIGSGQYGAVLDVVPTKRAIDDKALPEELKDREFALKIELERSRETTNAEATVYALIAQSSCPKMNVVSAVFWTRIASMDLLAELHSGVLSGTAAEKMFASHVKPGLAAVYSITLQRRLTGPTLYGFYSTAEFRDLLNVRAPNSTWDDRAAVVMASIAAQLYAQMNAFRMCFSENLMHNDMHANNVMLDKAGYMPYHWVIYELADGRVLVVPLFLTDGGVWRIMDWGLATGTYKALHPGGMRTEERIGPAVPLSRRVDATLPLYYFGDIVTHRGGRLGQPLATAMAELERINAKAAAEGRDFMRRKDFYATMLIGPVVAVLRTQNTPDAIRRKQQELVHMFAALGPTYPNQFANIFVRKPPAEMERMAFVRSRIK